MLDGVNLKIKILEKNIDILTKKFGLKITFDSKTGTEATIGGVEGTYKRTGNYRHLIIEVKKDKHNNYYLLLRGSLHKYWKGNNKGTFTGVEVMKAINHLCTTFGFSPAEAIITNMEIGVNIPVWFDVVPYLRSNLIFHKKKDFREMDKSIGYKCKHQKYLIKLYKKDKNLLRYEIKYSSIELHKYDIVGLADLLIKEKVNVLSDNLLPVFDEITMRDELDTYDEKNRPDNLTIKDLSKLNKMNSGNYINSYNKKLKKADRKGKAALRQEKYRLMCKCKQLINENGNGDHKRLSQLIKCQIEAFKNSWEMEKCHEIPLDKYRVFRDKIDTYNNVNGYFINHKNNKDRINEVRLRNREFN